MDALITLIHLIHLIHLIRLRSAFPERTRHGGMGVCATFTQLTRCALATFADNPQYP
jgi:hypothetical protein